MRIDCVKINVSTAKQEIWNNRTWNEYFFEEIFKKGYFTTYDVVSIKFFSMCGSSFLTRTSKPVTLCNTLN